MAEWRLIRDNPQFMSLTATMETAGLVVIGDRYDSGWKVTVDGEPAALLCVNHMLRGVELSKGSHAIELRYIPMAFVLGTRLCLSAAVILVAMLAWTYRSAFPDSPRAEVALAFRLSMYDPAGTEMCLCENLFALENSDRCASLYGSDPRICQVLRHLTGRRFDCWIQAKRQPPIMIRRIVRDFRSTSAGRQAIIGHSCLFICFIKSRTWARFCLDSSRFPNRIASR